MNDQRDLEGISALVTGATSGIGRAAAEELGRHGAEIVVHGRDVDRGSAVVDTITAEGGKARFVAADLSDPAQVDHLVDQVGAVDVLVNNAGFSWFGPTADLDVATFDRLFAANVRAAYFLVAALAPKMAARGSGSIINLGSMAGQIGLAGGAAYSATKATLAAMTRSWAAEFSPLRGPGQCHRCRAGPDQPGRPRPHRGPGCHDPAGPARPARRDRRGHRLPRLPESQLHHRRGHRRRRRPNRHLNPASPARGKISLDILPRLKLQDGRFQPLSSVKEASS